MKQRKNFKFYLLLAFLAIIGSAKSQPFGNGLSGNVTISGNNQIINDYIPVTAISGNELEVGPTNFYLTNFKVLIIQMEGSGAGTWEWGRVISHSGPNLFLEANLTGNYDINQKVQLILVPEYDYLTVSSGASLTCLPYDPFLGIGGVLVFNVRFSLNMHGVCDVSCKGYPAGMNGLGGFGGAGGSGGLAGITGQDGGNSGLINNAGANAGRGGTFGNVGASGSTAGPVFGPGSGAPANNVSSFAGAYPNALPGGGGNGGNGGNGASGAGGGGGGAGGAGATDGTNGADGANGGDGGNGGTGGGLIIFIAKTVDNNAGGPVFLANGCDGISASNADFGGNGGNGGNGIDCGNGEGGAGRGGNGGDGGDGGNGGAGGAIIGYSLPASSGVISSSCQFLGGNGGTGGQGGDGGLAGANGVLLNGSCPQIPSTGQTYFVLGSCDVTLIETTLAAMGENAGFPYTYSLNGIVHRWENTLPGNNDFVELEQMYPSLNLTPAWYVVRGSFNGNNFHAFIEDANLHGNLHLAFAEFLNSISNTVIGQPSFNVIPITFNNNGTIENYANYCASARDIAGNGSRGNNGSNGVPGNPGQISTFELEDESIITVCSVYHSASVTNIGTCGNDVFQININASVQYGLPNLNVSWSDGLVEDISNTGVLQNGYDFDFTRIVPAGDYIVALTSDPTCFTYVNITADMFVPNNYQTPEYAISHTQPTCLNPQGTISVEAFGSNGPFTYQVNASQPESPNGNFQNLPAGVYSPIITDASGCTTATFEITLELDNTLQILSSAITQPTCGNPTGNILLSTAGGVEPLSFTWTNNVSNSATAENLTPGFYNVLVMDANGCSQTADYEILPTGEALSIITNVTQPGCTDSLGLINITMVGGTPPINIIWSNPAFYTFTFIMANPGSYTVTATDAAGCSATASVVVNQTPRIQFSYSEEKSTCGLSNGQIVLLPTSLNNEPVSIIWSNGSTSNQLTNIPAGNYSATMSNASGCTAQFSTTISTTNPPVISNAVVQNVSCFDGTNGSVSFNATGESALNYTWNPYLNGTSSVNNLSAGNYTVIVTDDNLCSVTQTFEVTQPDKFGINAVAQNPSCYGINDGSITLNIAGGTSPFDINWGSYNGAVYTGLSGGVYSAIVTDANGCVENITVTLTSPQQIIASASSINPTCFGANNGSISIQFANGFVPSSVLWSPSVNPTMLNQTGLAAGNYTLSVTNQNGCSSTFDYTLISSSEINIALKEFKNNLCANENTALLMVEAYGGQAPYTFNWSNGANTNLIQNLPNGSYTVVVTDANGCSSVLTQQITSPQQLVINVTGNMAICSGSNTQLTVAGSGGLPPYTGIGVFNVNSTITHFSIYDANGCKVTQFINITETPAPQYAISASPICSEQTNGSVTLTQINAVQPVTFAWNNGASSQSISNVGSGSYSVTVTDGNGCSSNYATSIAPAQPIVISSTQNNTICSPQNSGSIQTSVNGTVNNTAFNYNWSNGETSPSIQNVEPGNYTVVVTDVNGCSANGQFTILNGCDCPYSFNVSICGPNVVCQNESIVLFANINPRPQGYAFTYAWTFNNIIIGTTANLTLNNMNPTQTGWYTLTVSFGNNCVASSQVFVSVRPRPTVTLINTLTSVDNYIHLRGCDINLVAGGGVYYDWTLTVSSVNTALPNHGNTLSFPTVNHSGTGKLTFSVAAVDSFGCRSNSKNAVNVQPRPLNIVASQLGQNVRLRSQNTFQSATYTWTGTNGWNPPFNTNNAQQTVPGNLFNLSAVYTLTVTQGSCTRSVCVERLPNGTFSAQYVCGTNTGRYSGEENINQFIELPADNSDAFKLFPNPSSDFLNFEFSNANEDILEIEILDELGKLVYTRNYGTTPLLSEQLPVQAWSNGAYFVHLKVNGETLDKARRFIKK